MVNLNFYVRLLYVQCMTQNKWSFMNKFNFLTSAKILFKECPISTKLTETEGNKFCNNRKGQSTDDYSSSSLPLQQSCRLPLRIWEIRFFCQMANYTSPLFFPSFEWVPGGIKWNTSRHHGVSGFTCAPVQLQPQPPPLAGRTNGNFLPTDKRDWSRKSEQVSVLPFLDYFPVNSKSGNIFSSVSQSGYPSADMPKAMHKHMRWLSPKWLSFTDPSCVKANESSKIAE